jgi:hypothetical protein
MRAVRRRRRRGARTWPPPGVACPRPTSPSHWDGSPDRLAGRSRGLVIEHPEGGFWVLTFITLERPNSNITLASSGQPTTILAGRPGLLRPDGARGCHCARQPRRRSVGGGADEVSQCKRDEGRRVTFRRPAPRTDHDPRGRHDPTMVMGLDGGLLVSRLTHGNRLLGTALRAAAVPERPLGLSLEGWGARRLPGGREGRTRQARRLSLLQPCVSAADQRPAIEFLRPLRSLRRPHFSSGLRTPPTANWIWQGQLLRG